MRISLSEPAAPRAVPVLRRAAAELAAAHGSGERLASDVELAVSEAVTNAVKYAYRSGGGGAVELRGAVEDGWLELVVADRGEGFGSGSSDGLGLGLIIIARLCSDLTIVQEGNGTTVRMRFPLPGR
ncbi:MAG TPA: ATP-binding protein [Solirubrobacterales bacterium]|nr:ATP-binding protein [Solirubrobacterales bacterium]